MRAAASRGTAVHELAENYLNNDELKNQEVLPLFMFTQLKSELDNINNIVMQEGGLYSDKWGIAGRVDCIAEYDGKLTVIDFKTSTKEKKEEWIENYDIGKLLIVDVSGKDFLNNPEDFSDIVFKIDTELHGLFSHTNT